MSDKVHYISPSDLGYLYDRCARCFYLKSRNLLAPKPPFPAVFRDIDSAMKGGITLKVLNQLGIPAKKIITGERVKSYEREYGGAKLVISGRTDRRVLLEDDTLAVIEFKTSKPRSENALTFWRQLSAYQYAEENPEGKDGIEVTYLGLVVFSPQPDDGFKVNPSDPELCYFKGGLSKWDVEIDRPKFDKFLEGLGKILAMPEMPDAGNACELCRHVEDRVQRRVKELALNPSKVA
jgi:hypothetical protein